MAQQENVSEDLEPAIEEAHQNQLSSFFRVEPR